MADNTVSSLFQISNAFTRLLHLPIQFRYIYHCYSMIDRVCFSTTAAEPFFSCAYAIRLQLHGFFILPLAHLIICSSFQHIAFKFAVGSGINDYLDFTQYRFSFFSSFIQFGNQKQLL